MRKITLLLSLCVLAIMASAQTTVANIKALKEANASLAFGASSTGTYTISGEVIVTFISVSSSSVRTIYIQDATAALMIYDSGKLITTSPALYCGLTGVTGTVKSYNGILELIPTVAPNAATSTNNTPFAPIETTLDKLIDYPLQLCKVKNVTISDFAQYTSGTTTYTPNGKFQSTKNFPLSVGGTTSTTVLRTAYADCDYINASLPIVAQDITGLVLPYQANSTSSAIVDFVPRKAADMVASSTPVNDVKANPFNAYVAGGKLKLSNVAENAKVEVFNAQGAKVQEAVVVNGEVVLSKAVKGLAIIRVDGRSQKITL